MDDLQRPVELICLDGSIVSVIPSEVRKVAVPDVSLCMVGEARLRTDITCDVHTPKDVYCVCGSVEGVLELLRRHGR